MLQSGFRRRVLKNGNRRGCRLKNRGIPRSGIGGLDVWTGQNRENVQDKLQEQGKRYGATLNLPDPVDLFRMQLPVVDTLTFA